MTKISNSKDFMADILILFNLLVMFYLISANTFEEVSKRLFLQKVLGNSVMVIIIVFIIVLVVPIQISEGQRNIRLARKWWVIWMGKNKQVQLRPNTRRG